MKLDKKLNLVVPVQTSLGYVHVHSMPIGLHVFEQHYLLLSKVFSRMYTEGLNDLGGPRVAALMLRDVAKNDFGQEYAEEMERTLINEIKRLSNVAMPAPDGKGWVTLPYDSNEVRQALDAEDRRDIEGFLCFFTLVSSLHTRRQIPSMMKRPSELWDFRVTSLSGTEWVDSLPTSTPEEISEETAILSRTPI